MPRRKPDEESRKLKQLRWVIGTPYFVEGSTSLTEIPILYFIKFVLGMGDAGGQLFDALRQLGWFVKPLWGLISDQVPLLGYGVPRGVAPGQDPGRRHRTLVCLPADGGSATRHRRRGHPHHRRKTGFPRGRTGPPGASRGKRARDAPPGVGKARDSHPARRRPAGSRRKYSLDPISRPGGIRHAGGDLHHDPDAVGTAGALVLLALFDGHPAADDVGVDPVEIRWTISEPSIRPAVGGWTRRRPPAPAFFAAWA